MWATHMIDRGFKSIDVNYNDQVFTRKSFFAKMCPMEHKVSAGDTLKLFCKEFESPEMLMSDGSKEQAKKGTQFMKTGRGN